MNLRYWIKAIRLRTLPLAVSGIVVGNALSYFYGSFDAMVFKLSVYTALLLQVLSNLANDYGDFKKGTDNDERVGPERALQSGKIKPNDMRAAMIVVGFFAFVSGSWLIYLGLSDVDPVIGLFFLGLGILCIIAAIFYTVGKNAYGYRGLGDLMVFLFFGVIAVGGSFYIQYKTLTWEILLPACAIGLFSAAVLNMNNMRDIVNDKNCGKITIPVRLGLQGSKVYHSVLILGGVIAAIVYQVVYLKPYMIWHLSAFIIVLLHLVLVWKIKDNKKFDGQLKLMVLCTLAYAGLLSTTLFLE